jgi:hypothetical protein
MSAVCLTALLLSSLQVDTVHNMWDGASYLYNNILEALGFSLGRARAYTATAANLAAEVAGTAYNTASHVAGTAVDVAANVAGTAVNVASNVAGTAANVAGQAAGTAYNAAGQAANVAAGTASMAYDTAGELHENEGQVERQFSHF